MRKPDVPRWVSFARGIFVGVAAENGVMECSPRERIIHTLTPTPTLTLPKDKMIHTSTLNPAQPPAQNLDSTGTKDLIPQISHMTYQCHLDDAHVKWS